MKGWMSALERLIDIPVPVSIFIERKVASKQHCPFISNEGEAQKSKGERCIATKMAICGTLRALEFWTCREKP